jgi:hypothetical protein
MARVNSWRESRPLESVFVADGRCCGQQPPAKKGGIPGLQRADRQSESGFARGVLAEREVLSTKPLRAFFNGL